MSISVTQITKYLTGDAIELMITCKLIPDLQLYSHNKL